MSENQDGVGVNRIVRLWHEPQFVARNKVVDNVLCTVQVTDAAHQESGREKPGPRVHRRLLEHLDGVGYPAALRARKDLEWIGVDVKVDCGDESWEVSAVTGHQTVFKE
jgi:hypothetical protein